MAVHVIEKDAQYLLNHCTKHLARTNPEARHVYGNVESNNTFGRVSEAWRFPIIDGFRKLDEDHVSLEFDEVTFVYMAAPNEPLSSVSVLGTFADLYAPLPLKQVLDTPYFALTVVVPRGEMHRYKYLVEGQFQLDPVNPQRITLDNGAVWSQFFTRGCTIPIVLENWERRLLDRLTDHILPFRSKASENFLRRHFQSMDEQQKKIQYRHDQSLGVVNYIDKLLAKEESHYRDDYQVCLELIDRVLRGRNPVEEPMHMSQPMFVQLYAEMGSGTVSGWDYSRYSDPRYFLQLLRRHTFTGAFSHPDYGGNAGAAAWAYLEERYRDDETGHTLFDWRRALPPPLGTNTSYRG